jgi:probable HAF family extracellular repeat protein
MHKKRLFALHVLLISLVAPLAMGQLYTVTDLGALSPTAINIWGQIAGDLNGHAHIRTPGQGLRNLGTLPGGTSSSAAAINDLGVVAGMADGKGTVVSVDRLVTQPCSDLIQAFVWSRAKGMQGVGALGVGGDDDSASWCAISSYANGINFFGQVVGNNDWLDNTYQNGFLRTNAAGMTLVPFPTEDDLPYYNDRADAINDAGQYVGAIGCCITLDWGHAALWTKSGVTDLGTLGGADPNYLFCSEASDINDLGQIVGWSTFSPDDGGAGTACFDLIPIHAVLLNQGGIMQDLGTLPGDTSSQAYKINLFGQIIGVSGDTLNFVYPPGRGMLTGRPFVWTAQSGMRDLNTLIRQGSGWVLNSVSDINIWGQIVGSGTLNGQNHGFLLTPR